MREGGKEGGKESVWGPLSHPSTLLRASTTRDSLARVRRSAGGGRERGEGMGEKGQERESVLKGKKREGEREGGRL
eukprot:183699-Rhodomonas_salina.1